MKFQDDIEAAFPRRRDDEPADLRSQIIRELRDHLESAFRGELLRTGDEANAERRVLLRFGDPGRMARKLWLDAMQEKIMSQRILMFWSGLMAAACIAMGGFVYRVVEQSAEANRTLINDMQHANRELLEQGRAFHLALIERLDRRPAPLPGLSLSSPHRLPSRKRTTPEKEKSAIGSSCACDLSKTTPAANRLAAARSTSKIRTATRTPPSST
jgi:hypothetical protein